MEPSLCSSCVLGKVCTTFVAASPDVKVSGEPGSQSQLVGGSWYGPVPSRFTCISKPDWLLADLQHHSSCCAKWQKPVNRDVRGIRREEHKKLSPAKESFKLYLPVHSRFMHVRVPPRIQACRMLCYCFCNCCTPACRGISCAVCLPEPLRPAACSLLPCR